MLTHRTLDQLNQLGLPGMAQAFAELEAAGDAGTLSHANWLGLLLDRELTHRRDKRLAGIGSPPGLWHGRRDAGPVARHWSLVCRQQGQGAWVLLRSVT